MMNVPSLEKLLQDADADVIAPAADPSLAGRVRARAKRQRRVRATGAGLLATAALITFGWSVWPHESPSPSPRLAQTTQPIAPAVSVPDARAELIELAEQADRFAARAEALWAAERPPARRGRRTPTIDVAAQVERAAFTMVYQAARMPDGAGASSAAADVYRQVTQSFPLTESADVARRRLNELDNRKDG